MRPFVRSIQRQSLSSRSSVASPLALSDSGVKPSWSLSAKLHMRSNSPSRLSLDSRCSPPLERIGEAGDDKVSTSCFGSYSRHERYFGSRSPLSSMESNASEQDGGKRFLDMVYCRAPTPVDRKGGKSDSTENNNQITAVDQNIVSAQATPTKEPKRKSSVGGFASKLESAASAKSCGKAEQEKSSKKRLCSTLKTPETPVKGKKASGAKEKSAGAKKSTATPSGTPSKKKEPPPEATPQQRSCGCSTPQSSASPSPPANKSPATAAVTAIAIDKGSAGSRRRLVERSCSRDSMHSSLAAGSALRGSPLTRSPAPKGCSESGARRLIRSSSSSSSVTSLRSPSVANRGSKPEEKGLSFFKNALRQRESRRSADLGKSSLLAKKSSERTGKQNGAAREAPAAGGGEKGKAGNGSSPPPSTSTSTSVDEKKSEVKATSRPAGSLGRSLLAVAKSKSSTAEGGVKSAASGKRPLDRVASSRKLSSPARTAPRPQ